MAFLNCFFLFAAFQAASTVLILVWYSPTKAMADSSFSPPPSDSQQWIPRVRSPVPAFGWLCPVAVVVDAGSTGTRSHIFRYSYDSNGCGGFGRVSVVVPDYNKKVRPGVSELIQELATGTSVDGVSEYLQPLKEFIKEKVTELCGSQDGAHLSTVPLLFRGTAGMRNMKAGHRDLLMAEVDSVVATWGMWYSRSWGLQTMSGDREAGLGWLAVNQLMDRFTGEKNMVRFDKATMRTQHRGRGLVGTVEMGGASAQVSIEIPESSESKKQFPPFGVSVPDSSKSPDAASTSVAFCDTVYHLYSRSYQGFGRQLALFHHLRNVLLKHASSASSCPDVTTLSLSSYRDSYVCPSLSYPFLSSASMPCLPSDIRVSANALLFSNSVDENLTIHRSSVPAPSALLDQTAEGLRRSFFAGGGLFSACREEVREVVSELAPLPFGLPQAYELVSTENYYYFNQYVVASSDDGRQWMSAEVFERRATEICGMTADDIKKIIHPQAATEKSHTACFGLLFMSEFLSRVVGVEKSKKIRAIAHVEDVDVTWPVAAVLIELPQLLNNARDTL
eukprot:GHVS01097363.1.p1 GENE.GHVS01097363.1~~GHVS01097363.1.p1  ORF type:complete len:562 (+),score=59.86 GHVS01097363.1:194-1879(+)